MGRWRPSSGRLLNPHSHLGSCRLGYDAPAPESPLCQRRANTRVCRRVDEPGHGDRVDARMRENRRDFVDRFEERFGGFMDERIDWF